ncbi:ATP-dependent DNA helicase [Myxococcus faecalis]|uniref:ATP-dependent DNA helicase n=1 Tax=Myxococcus faecalis TaxID=3115646 RepID=UPI003CEAAF1A
MNSKLMRVLVVCSLTMGSPVLAQSVHGASPVATQKVTEWAEGQRNVSRADRERQARLEREREERERQARLERERQERERLARLERERQERERLARLERERRERVECERRGYGWCASNSPRRG